MFEKTSIFIPREIAPSENLSSSYLLLPRFDLLVQSRFQSFLIVPHMIYLLMAIEKFIFSSNSTLDSIALFEFIQNILRNRCLFK